MATYTFLGGDFNNKLDWNPQGIPGAGDTIQDAGAAINAEGETVANAYGIDGDPIVVIGGLNITDQGYDLELQQGDYSVGSIEGAAYIFNDTAVSAGSIDLTLSNQALSLDDTSSLTVSGSVTANGDTIDTSGTFDVQGDASITNGTLEIDAGATTIGGALSLDTGSYLDLYQGERDCRFIERRRLHGPAGRPTIRHNAQGDGRRHLQQWRGSRRSRREGHD